MTDQEMVVNLRKVKDQVDERRLSEAQARPHYLDVILRLQDQQIDFMVRQMLDNQGIA